MATPASSQRNSERTEGVRSIANQIEGFIRPSLYVVRRGKANSASLGWCRGHFEGMQASWFTQKSLCTGFAPFGTVGDGSVQGRSHLISRRKRCS